MRKNHKLILIGSGTGGATELIFKGLKGAFASYTYTDISSGFFEKAQEKFAAHESQMIYKVCDIEKSPAEQGFTEGSYDLIVASLVLHATRNLEETMRNARKLLKPGGYLLMVELTDNDPMRFGFIFGGLPGWWLGYDDGRKLSPCVSAEAWNDLMLKTGFTGIDSHTPHNRRFPLPLAVISCQANDEKISFLREPLGQEHSLPKSNNLTIVGGETKMAEALQNIVKAYYKEIDIINSIDWIASNDLPFSGTVISLADTATESVFEKMSATRLTALQKMIQQSKNLVWVTTGAQSENPYKNMFVGLQRSVTLELTHVRHQIIDLEQPLEDAINMIAVRLLQLEAYGIWEEKSQLKNMLWHNEPEVSINNGQVLIPRYRLSSSRNDRYNAGRRAIFSEANENHISFSIKAQGNNIVLEKRKHADGRFDGTQLLYSLLEPVRMTDNTTAFVSLGKDISTDSYSILLSGSLDSVVRVPASWKIPAPDSLENGQKALVSLHYQLLARSILRNAKAGSKVAILRPEIVLGNHLAAVAKDLGVELVLLTDEKRCSISPWVYLHPRATTSSIRKLLPTDTSTFIFWKEEAETLATIRNCLPLACAVVEHTQIGNMPMHLDLSPSGIREVSDLLQNAWIKGYENSVTVDHDMTIVIDLNDISRQDLVLRQTMVSWQTENSVQIPVQPASKQVKFTAGRTYWLVGLTGGLGLSLCEWMAERGATHIALSSRNPNIEGTWIQNMASIGCTVRVFAK
jgi:hybrid polyketide synthase / nonribosomal peptide synthetase ACE1